MTMINSDVQRELADPSADDERRTVLTIDDLQKHFTRANGQDVPAIDGVSLSVKAGECLVLLGPSGCGKTTLLRAIAGLEKPDSGEIVISEQPVYSSTRGVHQPPQRRSLSMVFQSYALWPNMTIAQNIAYPLKQRRLKRAQIKSEVDKIAQTVGLAEVLGAYPNHISGGQQQRVALARALVSGDPLVLFDEPLSNVDAKVRKDLRVELNALKHRFGFASVYVTHDQEEAMEIGDHIAVLEQGKIAQLATPQELYSKPASRYVATFVGSANELRGNVVAITPDGAELDTLVGRVFGARVEPSLKVGDEAVAIFRPECGRVASEKPDSPNAWSVTYRSEMFSGTHAEHVATREHVAYRLWGASSPAPAPDSEAWMTVNPTDVHVFRP